MQPIFAIVGSGFNVSGDIDLTKRKLAGLFVPTLGSSGALALQANYDTTSAGFVRVMDARAVGSADLLFGVGVGSRYIPLPGMLDAVTRMRLEIVTAAGSLQTDNRTFTLLTTPR